MKDNISERVKNKAYELGYDLCGIIKAKSFTEFNDYLKLRVEKFPKSTTLYENLKGLGEPLNKAPWGKSIIVCARRYNKYKIPKNLDKYFAKLYLFDGRLSCSKEYSNKINFKEYLKAMGMKIYEDGVSAKMGSCKSWAWILQKSIEKRWERGYMAVIFAKMCVL